MMQLNLKGTNLDLKEHHSGYHQHDKPLDLSPLSSSLTMTFCLSLSHVFVLPA